MSATRFTISGSAAPSDEAATPLLSSIEQYHWPPDCILLDSTFRQLLQTFPNESKLQKLEIVIAKYGNFMIDDNQSCRKRPARYNCAHGACFTRFETFVHGVRHLYSIALATRSNIQRCTDKYQFPVVNFYVFFKTSGITFESPNSQKRMIATSYALAIKRPKRR